MDKRVLGYFLMVAREENITRAAQLLHITQPTLSRQLMQLEDELGVKLFDRSNHSIILTSEGLMLKRRAQEIVELEKKTLRDFKSGELELSGEISIGSGEMLGMDCFSVIMSGFQKEHPLVTYNIFSTNSQTIKERIESGVLDFGIVFDYIDISKYEYIRLPVLEEWGFIVKDDSPLSGKAFLCPGDVREQPVLLASGWLNDRRFFEWLGVPMERLNVVSSFNLLYNAAVMVKNGMGIAGGIRLGCSYDGTKFIPLEPAVKNAALFVWKKAAAQSPTVRAFIEFAQKYIK